MKGKKPRLIVVGSINRDLVVRCGRLPMPGETITAHDMREVSGGKGANQAVAASRAGAAVAMVGRVGSDAFADPLLKQLTDDGVDVSHVSRSDGSSGVAIVAVEDSGQNSILVIPGSNGRVEPSDVNAAVGAIRGADAVLLQLEVPLPAVLRAIELAGESGVRTILNPAPAPKEFDDRLLRVDLFCPNQSEAAEIAGHAVEDPDSARRAAAAMLARGARAVVVTLGASGAVVATAEGSRHVAAFAVTPVDTTAAGDAFAGALAVRWVELAAEVEDAFELELLAAAVRFACAAGGLAATAAGAIPSLARRKAIDSLLNG